MTIDCPWRDGSPLDDVARNLEVDIARAIGGAVSDADERTILLTAHSPDHVRLPALSLFAAVPWGLPPAQHLAWIDVGGGQQLWEEIARDAGLKPFHAGFVGAQTWFAERTGAMEGPPRNIEAAACAADVYRLGGYEVLPTSGRGHAFAEAPEAVESLGAHADLGTRTDGVRVPSLVGLRATGLCLYLPVEFWDSLDPSAQSTLEGAIARHARRTTGAFLLHEQMRASARSVPPPVWVPDEHARLRAIADDALADLGIANTAARAVLESYRIFAALVAERPLDAAV
jgi:hypothetical protein